MLMWRDWIDCAMLADRMDPQFIRERAEKLQEYLDHMLRKSTIIERRPVMEFLELNRHPDALQDTRAASTRIIRYPFVGVGFFKHG